MFFSFTIDTLPVLCFIFEENESVPFPTVHAHLYHHTHKHKNMFSYLMYIYVSSVMQVYVGVSKNKKYAICYEK